MMHGQKNHGRTEQECIHSILSGKTHNNWFKPLGFASAETGLKAKAPYQTLWRCKTRKGGQHGKIVGTFLKLA